MIIFIKHIDIEGPETLGEFLTRQGYDICIIALNQRDFLPTNFNHIEAVISLGGPMNVYEEEQYPFLRRENDFIQQIMSREIPFLGICLGSQLLAKACDAAIEKYPQKEIGFMPIQLTEDGKQDILFEGVEKEFDVFQWHEDMFLIPPGGKLLASAYGCPYQAFKFGPNAYGFQFHIEITNESIHDWSNEYFKKDNAEQMKMRARMFKDYQDKKVEFDKTSNRIYENFLKIIRE